MERWNWILENTERFSHIIGRKNIAGVTLLTFFTPIHITFRKEGQKGWGDAAIIGDTTTGKSAMVRKVQNLLQIGMIISAETASAVGLTGTAVQLEKSNWAVDWGALPLNDRKLVAIDGCQKLAKTDLAALAEAERSGIITVTKAGKAQTNCRTREIKIFNPVDEDSKDFRTKRIKDFLYPCQSLKTVMDDITIARLDLAAFSDALDLTPEQINNSEVAEYDHSLDALSQSVRWVWGNTAKVEWTQEAETALLEEATKFQKQFGCSDIPLVSADMKWKLARLSEAMAYITLSTEDYSTIKILRDHLLAVVGFLTNEYTKAGLNIVAQEEQHERLEIQDVQCMIIQLQEALQRHPVDDLSKILCYIALKGHFSRNDLMMEFNLAETNQVRPLISALQNEGLITNKKGFYATAKLNDAHRISNAFTDVTLLTCFNVDKNSTPLYNENIINKLSLEEKEEEKEGGTSLENGNLGKYGKNTEDLWKEIDQEVSKKDSNVGEKA